MDIGVYARVFWRFRVIVLAGILLGAVLAYLTAARGSEQWAAYSRIFVTQKGFPYGSIETSTTGSTILVPQAILYANLADSDPVQKLAFGNKKPPGTVQAAPVPVAPGSTDDLPLISIAGIADTPEAARHLASAETRALTTFVTQQQEANGIPPAQRVLLQIVKAPTDVTLLKGRSKTLPILVFLTMVIAACGLAVLLENLRPRLPIRAIETEPPARESSNVRRMA
jgi:hypothetical protein